MPVPKEIPKLIFRSFLPDFVLGQSTCAHSIGIYFPISLIRILMLRKWNYLYSGELDKGCLLNQHLIVPLAFYPKISYFPGVKHVSSLRKLSKMPFLSLLVPSKITIPWVQLLMKVLLHLTHVMNHMFTIKSIPKIPFLEFRIWSFVLFGLYEFSPQCVLNSKVLRLFIFEI